jgi:hemerythrin
MAQPGRKNGRPARVSGVTEHRQLEALFAEVRAALRERDREGAAASLERLRRLLSGHFESEEHLYYPTLRALRPERASSLLGFAHDHERLVERIARAQGAVEQASLAEANAALEQVAEEFARHEAGEDALLEALAQEIDREMPAPG